MNEPCDLCGSASFDVYVAPMYELAGARHDLVRCRSCSLVQVRPLPDAAAIRSMYGDDYFEKDYDSCLSEDSYFNSFPRLMTRYGALLDAIESLAPRGDLFEVGCAGGYFLKLARERGWRVRGTEITAAGAKHARDVFELDVEQGSFPMEGTRMQAADVVYMGHVLEHLRSPSAGIAATTRLVRPGGLLVVEVPSYIDSPYFRALRRMLPALRAAGLDRGGLLRALKFPKPGEKMEPFHLYEFRRATLTRLLERFGYRVLRTVSRVPKPDGVTRAIGLGFDALDQAALRLGLPGGNIAVFARRPADAAS